MPPSGSRPTGTGGCCSAGGENKLAERLPGEPVTLRLIEIEPNVRNRTLLRLLYA